MIKVSYHDIYSSNTYSLYLLIVTIKGVSLDAIKNYTDAIECYDRAIRLDSKRENFYYNKGVNISLSEKYTEAVLTPQF